MERRPSRSVGTVAITGLCALVVIAEGYDLIVFGTLIPSLLKEPGWGLTPSTAGTVGSLVYVGMLIGALLSGQLSDRFGRRRLVLASVAVFTVWTIGCIFAQSPEQLGAFRFLAGIGMGGVMPSILSLAKESAPPHRTALVVTCTMAGVPAGGTAAALIGLAIIPTYGWRPMFAVGAVLSVLVAVAAYLWLPESSAYRSAQRSPVATGGERQRSGLTALFQQRWLSLTLLFGAAAFTNLLTWYGLNTWLTTLMRQLDYPLASALQFSLTLNLAAILGSFVLAAAAGRWPSIVVALVGCLLTAIGLVGVTLGTSNAVVLLLWIALMGMGAHSALNLINATVADAYPLALRATALGWSNGVGRLGAVAAPQLGGWILAADLGPKAVFVAFLCSALASAVVLGLLVRRTSPRRDGAAGTRATVPVAPVVQLLDGGSRS